MAGKKTYIAIHEIHLCTKPGVAATSTKPAVAPVNEVVKPGATLELDPASDNAKELLAAGAMKAAPEAEKPAKKSAPRKTAAKKPAATKADEDGDDGDII